MIWNFFFVPEAETKKNNLFFVIIRLKFNPSVTNFEEQFRNINIQNKIATYRDDHPCFSLDSGYFFFFFVKNDCPFRSKIDRRPFKKTIHWIWISNNCNKTCYIIYTYIYI